jgi:hypothetical protein
MSENPADSKARGAAGSATGAHGAPSGPDTPSGPDAPDGPGASVGPEVPGLRAQLRATGDAVKGLVGAHVELARTEVGEIVGEISKVAAAVGIALVMLLGIGIILPVGLLLFLGDWIFGSIGWGVLDGVLLLIGIAVVAIVAGIGDARGRLSRDFVIAAILGVVIGVVLAYDLAHDAWIRLADALQLGLSASAAPLRVGAVSVAIVGAVIGLIVGARNGGLSGAWAGIVLGGAAGAILGAISAVPFSHRVGAAIGVTVGLLLWPALTGASLARRGIDTDAFKRRFFPNATIETTKETIEWVRAQTPLGRKS